MIGRPNHATRNMSSVAYLPSRAVSRMHAVISIEEEGVSIICNPEDLRCLIRWKTDAVSSIDYAIDIPNAHQSYEFNMASDRLCVGTHAPG
jgi:hypothetical protein